MAACVAGTLGPVLSLQTLSESWVSRVVGSTARLIAILPQPQGLLPQCLRQSGGASEAGTYLDDTIGGGRRALLEHNRDCDDDLARAEGRNIPRTLVEGLRRLLPPPGQGQRH